MVVTATSDEKFYFGPAKMGLPASFSGSVEYDDQPLLLKIDATFDGQRVGAKVISVERADGASVTPRDLTTIELGHVIDELTTAAVSPDTGAHVGRRPGRKPTPEELELVTNVYWYHHVTGGNPRQAVMAIWDLPRSTANGWLRSARQMFDFPET